MENISTGSVLMRGWKKNSLCYTDYLELVRKVGKSEALKKHTHIMTYIDLAYRNYCSMCYYFGVTQLNKGAWLRSNFYLNKFNQ